MALLVPYNKYDSDYIVDKTLVSLEPKITWIKRGGKATRKVEPREPISFFRMTSLGIHVPFGLKQSFPLYDNSENIKSTFVRGTSKKKLFPHQRDPFIKALTNLEKRHSVLLNLPTGFGKTYIAVQLWSLMKEMGVVLVDRVSLIDQWKQNIVDCFENVNVFVVGVDKLDEEQREEDLPTILICMIGRADKLPEWIRRKVGTVIIDEAHLFCTPNHIQAMMWFFPKKLILCSATPTRTDGADTMISMMVPEENHVVVKPTIPFEVHIIPTNLMLLGDDYGSKFEYAYKNQNRNNLICEIAMNCYNKGLKCMVLTNRVEHVDTLHDIISSEVNDEVQKYYMNQAKCKNYRIMIGTIPKIGTGFDESTSCQDFDGDCSNVLILCCTIKNHNSFIQVIGRVMRAKNPKIFILEDDDRMCHNHINGIKNLIKDRCGRLFKHSNSDNVNYALSGGFEKKNQDA